jgi:AcrR family transcriptional regulator
MRQQLIEPKQERARLTRRKLLDAAVAELVEGGYGALTTSGVARRAGVSRGAQQNHFPHKRTLVAEAVHHLALRQRVALRQSVIAAPQGSERVAIALDILFEQYSGALFASILELSLAARTEPELRELVRAEEREISRAITDTAITIFGERTAATRAFGAIWATVLSAVRGLALLKLLGHPARGVDVQWAATRETLVALLADWTGQATGGQ